MAAIRRTIGLATGGSKKEFGDIFITPYKLDDGHHQGMVQKKNQGDKELMMTLAKGDISEYNLIKKLSVEELLMKYETFIQEIKLRKK